MKLKHKLREMNACPEAIEWVADKDLKTAWAECERADWMVWLAEKLNVDRKLIVLAACDCAETVFEFLSKWVKIHSISRVAITTARKWCDGEATIEEVSYAAACAAIDAAYTAAYTAINAAAIDAADAAAYRAANGRNHKELAELVRKRIPFSVIETALKDNSRRMAMDDYRSYCKKHGSYDLQPDNYRCPYCRIAELEEQITEIPTLCRKYEAEIKEHKETCDAWVRDNVKLEAKVRELETQWSCAGCYMVNEGFREQCKGCGGLRKSSWSAKRIAELEAGYREAIEDIVDWSGYVSEYFTKKYYLAETLKKHRETLNLPERTDE